MQRIDAGVQRPAAATITVDGRATPAYPGESVAAALLASGHRTFRRSRRGEPRGPFCNMGVCFECVVEIDGKRLRACMASVVDGMIVSTSKADADR
jgi:predicted molibdopterin-dependent oxidoreductase YjgC